METVYCIFRAYGEDEGNIVFEFIDVCINIPTCTNIITKDIDIKRFRGITKLHESMNSENNYTYVGKREDINKQTLPFMYFGGYIIEKFNVKQ